MSQFLRVLLLAAFACTASASYAQETESDTTDAPHQPHSVSSKDLAPVEIRALRANADAPFAKTEISGDTLQRENLGQDLPVLLQYTPSAVVTTDAGAGVGYTGLRLRGTDGTRINVTLNGVAVNDAESQGSYFVDLPDLASSTSSIQIQRGVGSSTNGAGAFGGTVSISNMGLYEHPGAEGSISYGSFNTQKYTVQAGTGWINNRVALQARLSQITSDGFIDRSHSDLKSFQLHGAWKSSSKTTIQAMMLQGIETTGQAWNGVPEEKLRGNDSALLAHYYNNLGVLYFSPQDSANLFSSNPRKYNSFTYRNQVDHYRQNYYQIFADHKFSSAVTAHLGLFLTRGLGYYEEYKQNEAYSKYGLKPFITGSDTITRTDLIRQLWLDNYNYGAVYSLLWDAGKHTKVSFGGAASQYLGNHYGYILWAQNGGISEHYRWYKLDAQKNDFNFYGKAEHRIGKQVLLYGDLQWRSIGYFMNGFRNNPTLTPSVSYLFFNPKAGFTWFLSHSPLTRQKVYASFAAASHEPNRDDFEASPNNLPKPERLYDAEGGYEFSTDEVGFNANLYYMHYQDQLVLTGKVNDVGAYTRTNVPESYRMGVELQASGKPSDWMTLYGNATFSQSCIKDFTEYIDDYDNGGQAAFNHGTSAIAFSPSTVAAAGVIVRPFHQSNNGRAFSLEVITKFVGKQYLDNTSNEARKLNPYGLCDIRLHYNPALAPFRSIGFTLMLNNVLDKAYESNGYTYSYIYGGTTTTQNFFYPQAGINWLLGLNVKW